MINRLRENFTQISNDILSDKDLSLKAKGLYAFLCSKPDDWDFSYDGLSFQLQEGEKSIRSAVRELVEAQVLLRFPRSKAGWFDGWEWIINPYSEDIAKHVDPMKYPKRSSPSQSLPERELPKTWSSQNGYHISNNDSSNTNLSNTWKPIETPSVSVIEKEDKIDIESGLRIMAETAPELSAKLSEFLEYRKEIRKPVKPISFPSLVKKLVKDSGGSVDTAIEMIDATIANGWQWIFPLDHRPANPKISPQTF